MSETIVDIVGAHLSNVLSRGKPCSFCKKDNGNSQCLAIPFSRGELSEKELSRLCEYFRENKCKYTIPDALECDLKPRYNCVALRICNSLPSNIRQQYAGFKKEPRIPD